MAMEDNEHLASRAQRGPGGGDDPSPQSVASTVDAAQEGAHRDRPPPLEAAEPFPDYAFYQCSERQVPGGVAAAANVALDFSSQCMGCRFKVGSVVGQEIFQRELNPHCFIVWQDVSKPILPKLHVKSSSFAEVRLFSSPEGDNFIIDTKSLSRERAEQAARQFGRRSAPAFAVLHSRWTLQATRGEGGHHAVHIRLEAGGRTSGIANLIPKPILRYELRHVIEESLDFYHQIT